VAAGGHRLAAGSDLDFNVVTFEVSFDPECTGAPEAQPSLHSAVGFTSNVLTASSK